MLNIYVKLYMLCKGLQKIKFLNEIIMKTNNPTKNEQDSWINTSLKNIY